MVNKTTREKEGAMKLLSEQVGMCSSPGQFKDEDVLENLVDEKPVRRDMAFAGGNSSPF